MFHIYNVLAYMMCANLDDFDFELEILWCLVFKKFITNNKSIMIHVIFVLNPKA